ncbi:MAG: RsmB/NOP family class I SAM-dependent RNA methyltransferase [Bradymonadales bacterium]|nr:MAG: RsmB/NOP family class I SAM-dependent RNA methyltransferase [Bradymonadales bacterium]
MAKKKTRTKTSKKKRGSTKKKKTAIKKKPLRRSSKKKKSPSRQSSQKKKKKTSPTKARLSSQKKLKKTASVKKPAVASPQKAAKAQEAARPALSMTQAYKQFQEVWNPSSENFIAGLKKLFSLYEAPGKSAEEKEKNSAMIIEKIESGLRKEPVPDEILKELAERFPEQRVRQIASICSLKPRSSIRVNSLRVDIQGFAHSKAGADLKVKRCQFSPWGFDVGSGLNPIQHPLYERGFFEIEDEASQIMALMTNARPGHRVLDLCAREGDHTLNLACMMKNKGSLFVYDADPSKLKVLKARAQRAGVENIRILSDAQVAEVKSLDVVLVDSPSSSSGMVARQPELKWRFKREDLPKIQRLQAALLREAARKLKLGGHLIYATSSLNRSENEAQIENFLKSAHNSYRLVAASEHLRQYVLPFVQNHYGLEWKEDKLAGLLEFDPFLVLAPDLHGCNGLFLAILERTRISS